MSASMNPKEVYVPQKDVLYDITNKNVPVDTSTLYRGSNRMSAQTGGSVANTSGLNTTAANTKFVISSGSNYKLRWDTMALAVRTTFDNGTAGQSAAYGCPAWNAIADNIERMSLKINDSSVEIYNCSSGNYIYDYTARLLRNYTWDVLNDMNEEIFAPICALESEATISSTSLITNVSTLAGFNDAQISRRYVNRVATVGAYTTKMISFQNLFPRFPPCLIGNLRKIEIEIQWRDNSTDCMEHINDGVDLDTDTRMRITNCEIITDYYVMSAETQVSEVNQKKEGAVDNIAYLNTTVIDKEYSGADIIISGQRNVDSIMVLQLARGCENVNATREGQSCGQFMLINSAKGSATNTFPTNNQLSGSGTITPITSCQVQIGEINYPNYDLQVINDSSPDYTQLYYEYLKCLNCVANKTAKPMPFHFFATVMPFICLKCWSNNATHLSREGKDIILRIKSTITSSSHIAIIIFKTMTCQITPDSSVTLNY
jgi:hypothetical protein